MVTPTAEVTMLDRLPASGSRARRDYGATFFGASLVHAGVIVLAVAATRPTAILDSPVAPPIEIHFPSVDRTVHRVLPGPLEFDEPCADCFNDIQVDLPGVGPVLPPAAGGEIARTRPGRVASEGLFGHPGSGPSVPIASALADEPPLWLAGPRLVYPALLQAAGMEGEVTLELVIRADGIPDTVSVRVVVVTHPAFLSAARAAVLGARYRAGRLGNRPVPVLIRQTVRFELR